MASFESIFFMSGLKQVILKMQLLQFFLKLFPAIILIINGNSHVIELKILNIRPFTIDGYNLLQVY